MQNQIKQIVASLPGQAISIQADTWDDYSQSWQPETVTLSIGKSGGLRATAGNENVLAGLPARLRQQQLTRLLAGLAKESQK